MRKKLNLLFGLLLVVSSCAPLISTYDQFSYSQTTSLKVDALNVMDEATEDYQQHEAETKAVSVNIQKMLEYEKHRPKNELTTEQWRLISDTNGNLFGGFVRDWKTVKILKLGFINAKKSQVSRAFDEIIKLESKKIK